MQHNSHSIITTTTQNPPNWNSTKDYFPSTQFTITNTPKTIQQLKTLVHNPSSHHTNPENNNKPYTLSNTLKKQYTNQDTYETKTTVQTQIPNPQPFTKMDTQQIISNPKKNSRLQQHSQLKSPPEQRTTKRKPYPSSHPLPYSTYNSPQGNTPLLRFNDNSNTKFYKTKIDYTYYPTRTRHLQNQNKLHYHPGTQHSYSPTNCMRCCF